MTGVQTCALPICCVTWVLLALVHSTKPARFNSQHVQPGDVAVHPQSMGNRVRQTPIAWHQVFARLIHVTPIGSTCRTSRRRKQYWLCRIQIIPFVQLGGSARFTDGCLVATCMLQCCGSLQRSRLPLTEQQATANQLQLKWHKRIALHLRAMMSPLFATRITYMHGVFFRSKPILIQVS